MRTKIMLIMLLSALDNKTRSVGGVDTVCQMQLEGLKRYASKNNDYIILAFNPASDLPRNGEVHNIASNVQLHWYNYDRRVGLAKPVPNFALNESLVRRLIKRHRPDVVHSHNPAWHIVKYYNEKKILTLHTYQKLARTPVGLLNDFLHERLIQPQSVRTADVITTVSAEIINMLKAQTDKRIVYIPNPINTTYFSNKRLLPETKGINLLLTGYVEAHKRQLDALKILSLLHSRWANLHLYIAGRYNPSSPYYRLLQTYIQQNNLQSNVHFLGLLDLPAMLDQIGKTHIGLSLSESETFGLAPLEMMAAGVPVVTTEVGVFQWHKHDFQERGVDIIQPGNITAAAQAITDRIIDKNFSISPELKKFLEEEFSLLHYIKENEECYQAERS